MIINKLLCALGHHEWDHEINKNSRRIGFPDISIQCHHCQINYNSDFDDVIDEDMTQLAVTDIALKSKLNEKTKEMHMW